jgi:nucleoid DNA-binding protein/cell division protein FtsN
LEINLIIRELLAKHNYISLPGLGSFIQTYEPAQPTADGKGFISPKQSITFDSSRNFNDEAIESYLCEKLGIDHPEAAKLISDYVRKTQEDLSNGKDCVFENVGTLTKNKKGKIQFKQAKDLEVASATYGLKDVDITATPKVAKLKTAPKVEPKPIPRKQEAVPAKKSSSSKALVVIAMVVGIVALSATFILIPDLRFWNTLTATNGNGLDSKSDTLNKSTSTASPVSALADVSTVKKDSLNTKVDKTISDNSVKKTALYYEEPKIQDNKLYYIIVGSFSKLENAQKLAEKFNQKGFKTEIIQGNSMFRVSVNQFSDKNRAISEFNKFRNNYPNESVWVLGI